MKRQGGAIPNVSSRREFPFLTCCCLVGGGLLFCCCSLLGAVPFCVLEVEAPQPKGSSAARVPTDSSSKFPTFTSTPNPDVARGNNIVEKRDNTSAKRGGNSSTASSGEAPTPCKMGSSSSAGSVRRSVSGQGATASSGGRRRLGLSGLVHRLLGDQRQGNRTEGDAESPATEGGVFPQHSSTPFGGFLDESSLRNIWQEGENDRPAVVDATTSGYHRPSHGNDGSSSRYRLDNDLVQGLSASKICCADCQDRDIVCLGSCVRSGCNTVDICGSAGKGAYASFCQKECNPRNLAGLSVGVEFLPDAACRGFCAGKVQKLCAAGGCREYGCFVPDCHLYAPQVCG